MFVFVCVCCVSLLHLSYVSDFIRFFIRAVFSAVFSLTVLSGLLFLLLIDFFLVLLSMANKDSFIQLDNVITTELLYTVTPCNRALQ